MSNNTVRIRTTPNGSDKYLKVKLEQDFDFIEILSLKITQEEAYTNYCSDYGVVAGRVIINSGFGVPNARVSIFIPLDDIDKNNPQIKGLYPYEVITDKNHDGIRYNTLPKSSETDNDCFTEIGTFPNKREILDNTDMLEVYCKYYKFTTTTNYAGDFMIFGVPLGTYTIHVDADISDIGIASQRPYDSISQGTPTKFFDSSTKYKGGTNLDRLIQVKSANAGVNVQPFWGNTDTCEIGITRVDLDLNYNIKPSAIFMGNMFGDQDKDSVSKNCKPRRDVGGLCNQVSNEGTIEMIRETIEGTVENFDVEGTRLIDENGSWAYQIPMNLDYMVTSETGVLQPSDDPNKGLPTRASVRFRIGLDQTGGEGRLRTRAKYLVPNNPSLQTEIDYEFGNKTKKTSFRDLYWNKIYSVSNFISRYQQTSAFAGGVHTRNITGIKDVDDCGGDKTPFPYNKVNTSFTPLFFIICLIIKIVGFLIYMMNALIIPLINVVLMILNVVLMIICKILYSIGRIIDSIPFFSFNACKLCIKRGTCCDCDEILSYIPCVHVKCPNEGDHNIFAPGCSKHGLDGNKSYKATGPDYPDYYNGDSFGHGGLFDLCGLDDCVAFEMAKSMHLFQFDFYNDWINGSLYSFLLKYKKKRKTAEKFCEYDCSDWGIAEGGVDGNNNGNPDNDCRNNSLVDVCFNGGKDSQFKVFKTSVREGLIKKLGDEFYYAASSHDARVKIFATDIINLGAVFSCDWQGVPKVQPHLVPTTYKIAPDIQEIADDQATVLTTGQCDIDGNTLGIFFSINCLGLHVNETQCLNLRHQCEFGVELDENRQLIGGPAANGIIGVADLDLSNDDRAKWVRDVFYGLNISANTWTLNYPYSTNFNLLNCGQYDFSYSGGTSDPCTNGNDYIKFRGYPLGGASMFAQPKHSYFFYFGIIPGKTGLDKMNQRFFTTCIPKTQVEFNVVVSLIPITFTNLTATANISFIGGVGPFSYTISGPNNTLINGVVTPSNGVSEVSVTGLAAGTYTLQVTSSDGSYISQTISVLPPGPLFANAFVSDDCNSYLSPNGEITVSSAGGGNGSGTYTYELFNSLGVLILGPANLTAPQTLNNLPLDMGVNGGYMGYTLTVTDSVNATVDVHNLIIHGPSALTVTSLVTNVTCFGRDNGAIHINANGGVGPYSASTIAADGYYEEGLNLTGLSAATYSTTVVDSENNFAYVISTVLSLNAYMEIAKTSAADLQSAQNDPDNYKIIFYVNYGGTAPSITIEYNIDDAQDANSDYIFLTQTIPFVNSTQPVMLIVPADSLNSNILIRMSNTQRTCHSTNLSFDKADMILPAGILKMNVTGIDNTKQCTPNKVTFKFNINDLQNAPDATNNPNYRASACNQGGSGYFSDIWVTGHNLAGTQSVQQTTATQIRTNQFQNAQSITLPVPMVGGLPAATCTIYVQTTFMNQCFFGNIGFYTIPNANPSLPGTYPVLNIGPIVLPNTLLNGSWADTIVAPNTIKKLNAFGGIQPYTSTPYHIYDGTALTQYSVPTGTVINSMITDSVGCKKSV